MCWLLYLQLPKHYGVQENAEYEQTYFDRKHHRFIRKLYQFKRLAHHKEVAFGLTILVKTTIDNFQINSEENNKF